jgi:hypothetical protein
MTLVVALMMNFKYHHESEIRQATPPQTVKKVVVIKKIYIRVPSAKDSTGSDTTIITLPKETPPPNFKKYYRSRNLHRNGFIS